MMKILLWIGVIVVVLLGLRLLNVAKARKRSGTAGRSAAPPPAEAMIRCSQCGVYLPKKDAIPGRSGPTCGEPACLRSR